ncbi:MAG TPA: L-threonylcarbamoyladenylate synthase [Acidimicrobiales bacterium]|nr:L-threonylcarbamoyladenylate synthase [Acidimicrobiales bacterium]
MTDALADRLRGGARAELLDRAASALGEGRVVAIPTDTVYGLAVLPGHDSATDRLFALKERPGSQSLPVLVSGIEQADRLAEGGLSPSARRIAERFWPGGVTLVVRRSGQVSWTLGGDETTVGVRCPADQFARALCERVGPLATTSANLHGDEPLKSAGEIRRAFGDRVALVVDGGYLHGPSSTVVDTTACEPRCVREGAVPFDEIIAVGDQT